jgi:transcriptional regulatory protein LevR
MSKRINITVSDSVYEILRSISENYGMPVSSLGSVAIMNYLEQKQAVNIMENLPKIMEDMQKMIPQGGKENV